MKNLAKLTLMLLFLSFTTVFSQDLRLGQTMVQNMKYYSPQRNFYLIFQRDGNLVMYNRNGSPMWDSRTTNKGYRSIFQNDGNLVVYNRANTPLFNTNTMGRGSVLRIQNDGNLVVYDNSELPLWTSMEQSKSRGEYDSSKYNIGTLAPEYNFEKNKKIHSANGEFHLVFQDDGNLVEYDRNKRVIWASNTQNRGYRATFQKDGNLVVYAIRNQPIFNTGTQNMGANKLIMQDDGNLVIYNNDKPIWAAYDQK